MKVYKPSAASKARKKQTDIFHLSARKGRIVVTRGKAGEGEGGKG